MPRDGSNIYSQPFPDVVEDTTIESTVYNGFTNDVAADLNAPRPIVAGGTAATSADQALFNLAAGKAAQLVTNYDSHLWVPGSFRSAAAATGAPNALHAFSGLCYIGEALANPPTNQNVVVEARDNTDGALYIRRKTAGTWGSWVTDGDLSGVNAAIALKVAKAGDTMTGPLELPAAAPTLGVQATNKTYVDALIAALPVINTHAGYFSYVSATQVSFVPWLNQLVKINGVNYSIPVAGVTAGNTGITIDNTPGSSLAANTLYYVYAFNNAGTLTISFSTTAYATSSTAGNIGSVIKSGDDTRTLIGMVFTNASSQFVVTNVISWFNKKNRQISASSGVSVTTTPTAVVEFCTWGDEAISFGLQNRATNGTVQGSISVQLTLEGAVNGNAFRNDVPGAASIASATMSGTRLLTAGRHLVGMSATFSGTPSAGAQETYVMFRG